MPSYEYPCGITVLSGLKRPLSGDNIHREFPFLINSMLIIAYGSGVRPIIKSVVISVL